MKRTLIPLLMALCLAACTRSAKDSTPAYLDPSAPLEQRVKGKRNKNLAISERSLALIDSLMDKEVFHCEDHR